MPRASRAWRACTWPNSTEERSQPGGGRLHGQPERDLCEPNFYAYADDGPVAAGGDDPNDPYFAYQWNLPPIQIPRRGIPATAGGAGRRARHRHRLRDLRRLQQAPDLANTRFIPGYDFVNGDTHANDDEDTAHTWQGPSPEHQQRSGVAGVAYGATLIPVKVLDGNGQGSYDIIAQGIVYAANQGLKSSI